MEVLGGFVNMDFPSIHQANGSSVQNVECLPTFSNDSMNTQLLSELNVMGSQLPIESSVETFRGVPSPMEGAPCFLGIAHMFSSTFPCLHMTSYIYTFVSMFSHDVLYTDVSTSLNHL